MVVGAVAIVAAGVFAITRLAGDGGDDGGADSPEEAGLALLRSVEDEDVLGMIDVLLPGERETLRDPATELLDELRRLEVLSSDASLDRVEGVDIVIEDEEVSEVETIVDDIVNISVHGDISVSVDGEALPIGDLVYDNAPDADPSQADLEATEPLEFDVPLTAVERDGRWYLSAFYSVAEQARAETDVDIPRAGIEPQGGDSPEAAVDLMLGAIAGGDLEGAIAALNPQEFEALQRYAPAFLPDAEQELDEAEWDATIDAEYRVEGSGDTRFVTPETMTVRLDVDQDTIEATLEDGCLTLTVASTGETTNSCEDVDATLDEQLDEEPRAAEVVDSVRGILSDYENPGVVVEQVDGSWYVSPMATGAEQVLAFLRALDREEIDQLIGDVEDALDESQLPDLPSIPEEILEEFDETTDDGLGDLGADDDAQAVDTVEDERDATVPEDSVSDDSDEEPWGACWGESTASAAADCFQGYIDSGQMEPAEAPVLLLHDECGLAESFWSGDYYSLADKDFVEAVASAAPCFQDLVAAGTVNEFSVPPELLRPECLEDRNRYGVDDEEYLDRFYDCAWG